MVIQKGSQKAVRKVTQKAGQKKVQNVSQKTSQRVVQKPFQKVAEKTAQKTTTYRTVKPSFGGVKKAYASAVVQHSGPKDPTADRLERYIAHSGQASRREAKRLILAGAVTVNGTIVTDTGFPIKTTDVVVVQDGLQSEKSAFIYYKPLGRETEAIVATMPPFAGMSAIGRLDKETEGLIILSNDGVLTRTLTGINTTIGKTYRVVVRENVTDEHLLRMSHGIILEGTKQMTKPAIAKRLSRHSYTITLFEGQKHQVRRMAAACRLTIDSLARIAIGHLTIGAMKPNNYKKLTEQDIALLKQ